MTNRKVLSAALLAASLHHGAAQNMIADAWKSMPDSIIPILNANARSEVLEMSKFGADGNTKNLLGGECKLISMTGKMIDVKLTEKTGVQLLLLEKPDSARLICMNKYYGSPAIDSDITFYTEDWKEDTSVKTPEISDDEYFRFLSTTTGSDSISSEYEKSAALHPVVTAARLSDKNGGELSLTANAPIAIATEKNGKTASQLQKSFKWNGYSFK